MRKKSRYQIEVEAKSAWYTLLWMYEWPHHCRFLSEYMAQD